MPECLLQRALRTLEETTLPWTTTFRPNSATRYDARARPDEPLLLSSAGPAFPMPSRFRTIPRGLVRSRGEPCILRDLLDEPLRERHPYAFASRERAQDEVLKRRARRSRSFYLSSRKPSASFGDAEDLIEFQSKQHEPEIVSEGLACSTPHCGGCSMRVPLLANLRTSSCRRSQRCGSWSGERTNCNQPWNATGFRLSTKICSLPRFSFRGHPAKDGAIPKIRMFGAVPRPCARRGLLPEGLLLLGLRPTA